MDKIKVAIIAAFTALTAWMGVLAMPVYLLVGLGISDYFTGVVAAKNRGQKVNSKTGIIGVAKKVFLLLLVALGGVMDWLIMNATSVLGLELPFTFVVATLVAVWLICNELISIMENLIDIGVKVPPFMLPIVRRIKGIAEEKTEALVDGVVQGNQNMKNSED